MAIIAVNGLTSSLDTTDLSTYATASITPTPNALILIAVASRIAAGVGGGPQAATVTGCGLTWVQVKTEVTFGATPNRKMTLLRAMGAAPTTGALSIDFNGETQTQAAWSVVEFVGARTGGTNGSTALVQSGSANDGGVLGTTAITTLSAFESSSHIAFGAVCVTGAVVGGITPGSGFTEIHEVATSENGTTFETEYKKNDVTVDATWTGNNSWFEIACEVAQGKSKIPTSLRPRIFAPGVAR